MFSDVAKMHSQKGQETTTASKGQKKQVSSLIILFLKIYLCVQCCQNPSSKYQKAIETKYHKLFDTFIKIENRKRHLGRQSRNVYKAVVSVQKLQYWKLSLH